MKFATWAFCLALLAAAGWAQAAPPHEPAPPPPPPMHGCCMHGHHRGMSGSGMALPDMKAQVEKMRATLEQMKANLAKVKDPALKQQAQLDVDLWEAMVGHMEGMVKMMAQPPEPATGVKPGEMGGMHMEGGCCCCGGMKHGDGAGCMHGEGKGKPSVPAQ